MSEKELNSYRFGVGEEPTDEMLAHIMKEVAQEARENSEKVTNAFFEQMQRNIVQKQQLWAKQISEVTNG